MIAMFLTFALLFHFVHAKSFYMPLPDVEINFSNDTHLTYEHVKLRCLSTDKICKDGGVDVCAKRMVHGERQLRHFENSCYLFMSNMCDHPGAGSFTYVNVTNTNPDSKQLFVDHTNSRLFLGKQYSIITTGSCEHYMDTRRDSQKDVDRRLNKPTPKKKVLPPTTTASPTKPIARASTMSTLYEVDSAFDFHSCPLSCPDIYQPVCVSVNRGFGLHFKFFTFVNHCAGDLYYCKHWQEFSPPPDEDENVASSQLGWSYCGSSRYLQFARFAEVASSMGHYGWLAGNYKYTHIMEPHQRMKGYG